MHTRVEADTWRRSPGYLWSLSVDAAEDKVLAKCEQNAIPLSACAEFCLGLTPYDKYRGHSPEQIRQRVFHSDHKADDTFKPLLVL